MILIAYDGSRDAQLAVDYAAELFAGQAATVLTVWEPFVERTSSAGEGAGLTSELVDSDRIDHAYESNAMQRASEGAERARRAGLNAQPEICARTTTVAAAILAEAKALEVAAIVIGSRGRTGIKSMLLGSVSRQLLHHADRPVILVPPPG